MFTGLIEEIGVIDRIASTPAGRELRVRCRYDDLVPGESVAVNGACLTVREQGPGWFTVAAVATTLDVTTIGTWREGKRVNLERAMRAGARLGGHIVQGHVDGIGTVMLVTESRDDRVLQIALPVEAAPLAIPHGSITIDGVSLTIQFVADVWIEVALIDYTLRHTTLSELGNGDTVHVESDVIGKFVRKLAFPYMAVASSSDAARQGS